MKGRQGCRESFVIAGQSPKSGRPCKGSFHHPAPRQEDESVFGLVMFDDLQSNAFLGGSLGGLFSGVTLIDKGDPHRFFHRSLHGPGHLPDLGAVLFIGRGDRHCQ